MTLPFSQPSWFDSSETGAPSINHTAGTLREVLRACLVNGFNPRSVTSIVVASGVATATAATHGYSAAYGKLLLIQGSGEALLNGRKQPLSVATNTFTFAAPGAADGTYTGTITAKRAPLGWIEIFTGTNRAIFQRTAPEANASVLRVFDTRTSPAGDGWANMKMAESASTADTMVNARPASNANCNWMKGVPSDATAQLWSFAGCDRGFFYFAPHVWGPESFGAGYPYYFGDIKAYAPGDVHSTLLVCDGSAPSYGSPEFFTQLSTQFTSGAIQQTSAVLQRSLNGSVIGRSCNLFTPGVGPSTSTLLPASIGEFPVVGPCHIWDGTNIRGELPGWYLPAVTLPFTPNTVQDIGGRKFLAVDASLGSTGPFQPLLLLSEGWY